MLKEKKSTLDVNEVKSGDLTRKRKKLERAKRKQLKHDQEMLYVTCRECGAIFSMVRKEHDKKYKNAYGSFGCTTCGHHVYYHDFSEEKDLEPHEIILLAFITIVIIVLFVAFAIWTM